MNSAGLPALISIHDVMPETLGRVGAIADEVAELGLGRVPLLVTPGHDWRDADLAELHRLAEAGHELAGHGWTHRVERVKGLRHRLYSAIISRRAAEHMELDEGEIVALLERNFQWFESHGFTPPSLYVPPAWALGAVSKQALEDLPFRWYETLTGVYDARTGQFVRLPVVGYEADTWVRAAALQMVSAANVGLVKLLNRPFRVALHPYDLEYKLAGSLRHLLAGGLRPVRLETLFKAKPV